MNLAIDKSSICIIALSILRLRTILAVKGFTKDDGSFSMQDVEDPAVTRFRTYLRFDTSHPNPEHGYNQSIEWLRGQAKDIGLDFNVLDLEPPNLFGLWITYPGSDPSLKSVMLDSHMDVVPADPSRWIHPPFDAFKDTNGDIYARGASDMKCATIATLEALRRLKNSNFQPLRNIHLTVMPDEEVGGERGIIPFLKTQQFKDLNVGIDIDEGNPGVDNSTMTTSIGEKSVWQFNYTATGVATHAAFLPQFTAAQRLQVVIDRILGFRAMQFQKLSNPDISIQNITTVNLVGLGGGVSNNVVAPLVWASFDMRVWSQPGLNFTDLDKLLEEIRYEAFLGSNDPNETVTLTFITKEENVEQTIANSSNPWWNVMQKACQELGLNCVPEILLPVTDGRHVRSQGINVFGLSPFPNSPSKAHQDNEFMNEFSFLEGINRFEAVIKNLSTLSGDVTP